MADMNMAIFTGVVPDFKGKGNAVIANNIEDEQHANVILKLDVQRRARTQDGSYENKSDVLTFHAFGKTAQQVVKMAKPGTGLRIEAHVAPSQKMVRNGQDVLDANGKAIWTGERLMINSYNGINFVRDYSKRDNAGSGAQAGGAAAAPFDPMAAIGGTQAPAQAPASQPSTQASVPEFDFNPTEFPAGMNLPF